MGSNKISIGVGITLFIMPFRRKSKTYNVSKSNLRKKVIARNPFDGRLGHIAAEYSCPDRSG